MLTKFLTSAGNELNEVIFRSIGLLI